MVRYLFLSFFFKPFTLNLLALTFLDVWRTHRDTAALKEKLAKYVLPEEESSQEDSDVDFDYEKDENEEENSSEEEVDYEMTSKNPYAILADD